MLAIICKHLIRFTAKSRSLHPHKNCDAARRCFLVKDEGGERWGIERRSEGWHTIKSKEAISSNLFVCLCGLRYEVYSYPISRPALGN